MNAFPHLSGTVFGRFHLQTGDDPGIKISLSGCRGGLQVSRLNKLSKTGKMNDYERNKIN